VTEHTLPAVDAGWRWLVLLLVFLPAALGSGSGRFMATLVLATTAAS